MISSASSPDRTPRPATVPTNGQPAARPLTLRPDHLSTDGATFLRSALERHPEIRPDVVERGRELAADPSYPPPEVVRRIGEIILSAPDLSEDQS